MSKFSTIHERIVSSSPINEMISFTFPYPTKSSTILYPPSKCRSSHQMQAAHPLLQPPKPCDTASSKRGLLAFGARSGNPGQTPQCNDDPSQVHSRVSYLTRWSLVIHIRTDHAKALYISACATTTRVTPPTTS
jgi:hypothetical protein